MASGGRGQVGKKLYMMEGYSTSMMRFGVVFLFLEKEWVNRVIYHFPGAGYILKQNSVLLSESCGI